MTKRRKGAARTAKQLLEQLARAEAKEARWFSRMRRALTGMATERAEWKRLFRKLEALRAEQADKRRAKRAAVHQEEEE